ncbi:preprotein translocase subunit YajC [Candidatus Aquiluna sp. UB-MaderosW2red]|uniref:preprotein translocase subunit YajC n=1 Tax=Candidatus Aquiluna sp. UB-MaderosW2red TaxID=1855377 RepID=UPI000875D4ED|nr:preprotein translocase subunit YajC [Candidatus Aquiluna sp. UB-MaderosW2red]SCX11461.1 preprotein translocase subunit YajC [Candidatus Aquiluna sp. UB-MaderosW2red]
MDLILIGVLAVMVLLLINQNRKRKKDANALVEALVVGAKVILHSGIKGTVTLIEDSELEIESTPGAKLRVVKQAVRTIEKEIEPEIEEEETDPKVEGN